MQPITIITDIAFATHRHPRLVGDLFLPQERQDAQVALVIHGGGWSTSDKSTLSPVCMLLVESGIAVFSINYRRLPEAPWPACYDDCVTAFDFVRDERFQAKYGLKADRLLVVGASAGGHLALMTALSRPAGQVSGIVAIAPPTRLQLHATSSNSHLYTPKFFSSFFGSGMPVTAEALAAASPVHLVGPQSPPLWIVHNRRDQLVPLQQSEELARAYRKNGRSVHLHLFDGTDTQHGLWLNPTSANRRLAPLAREAMEQAVTEVSSTLSPLQMA